MDKGLILSIQDYSRETTQELVNKLPKIAGIRTDKKISCDCPVIGLKKIGGKDYYITTTKDAIIECTSFDYIALDSRRGNIDLMFLLAFCQVIGKKVVADIECLKDIDNIVEICDKQKITYPAYIATTFSFLKTGKPDLDLIKEIDLDIPIIAEGKFKTKKEIEKAIENGASNICIGAEISDMSYLTTRYLGYLCY